MIERLIYTERLDTGVHFFKLPNQSGRGNGFMPNNPTSLSTALKLSAGDEVVLTRIPNYQLSIDDFDLLQEEDHERVFCNCMDSESHPSGAMSVTTMALIKPNYRRRCAAMFPGQFRQHVADAMR